jgi:hypothetical protein
MDIISIYQVKEIKKHELYGHSECVLNNYEDKDEANLFIESYGKSHQQIDDRHYEITYQTSLKQIFCIKYKGSYYPLSNPIDVLEPFLESEDETF